METLGQTTYQRLPPEQKEVVRCIIKSTTESLETYAKMMERGTLEMMPGPVALRFVAELLRQVMAMEDAGQ